MATTNRESRLRRQGLFATVSALILIGLAASGCDIGRTAEFKNRISDLESENEALRNALSEANQRIQNAAEEISNAKMAVSDCESSDDVEMIEEPEPVEEP
jgi:hypothetical protein